MARTTEVYCDGWSDFKTRVVTELFPSGQFKRGVYLYRGQRSAEWRLESSFDRWIENLNRADRTSAFQSLVAMFKRECESVDAVRDILNDDTSVLALAQHYGMPTRLLDWSESPYIAGFFAFSDAIVFPEGEADYCAVWALDMRRSIWSGETGAQILLVPSFGNTRLRNQSGRFTLSKTPFRYLDEYAEHCSDTGIAFVKFCIPLRDARLALADLDAMGISHSSMFPGIEGCAAAARMRVMLEHMPED